MKKINVAILVLLSSALLFNQVGLHFFHDRHDAHEYFEAAKKNQSMLLNHGEHCQVCSLEILFHVVLPVSTEVPLQVFVTEFNAQDCSGNVFIFFDRPRGRAPPSVA